MPQREVVNTEVPHLIIRSADAGVNVPYCVNKYIDSRDGKQYKVSSLPPAAKGYAIKYRRRFAGDTGTVVSGNGSVDRLTAVRVMLNLPFIYIDSTTYGALQALRLRSLLAEFPHKLSGKSRTKASLLTSPGIILSDFSVADSEFDAVRVGLTAIGYTFVDDSADASILGADVEALSTLVEASVDDLDKLLKAVSQVNMSTASNEDKVLLLQDLHSKLAMISTVKAREHSDLHRAVAVRIHRASEEPGKQVLAETLSGRLNVITNNIKKLAEKCNEVQLLCTNSLRVLGGQGVAIDRLNSAMDVKLAAFTSMYPYLSSLSVADGHTLVVSCGSGRLCISPNGMYVEGDMSAIPIRKDKLKSTGKKFHM